MFHILRNFTILNNKSRILNKQSFWMGWFIFWSKYIVSQIKSFEILGVWFLKFEELGIWYPTFEAHGVWSTFYCYTEFEVFYITLNMWRFSEKLALSVFQRRPWRLLHLNNLTLKFTVNMIFWVQYVVF